MQITRINISNTKLPFLNREKNAKNTNIILQGVNSSVSDVFFKSCNLSFEGKPSTKKNNAEQNKKKELYKTLRKQGCGEKATSSVINNDKKFKRLIDLIDDEKGERFSRTPSLKELVVCVENDFSNEQVQRFIDLQDFSKREKSITIKDVEVLVKNNFDDEQIKRYINLRHVSEDGKTLLNRQPTRHEASIMINNAMSDIQADTYLRLVGLDLYFSKINFVTDEEKLSRFISLTSEDENGNTLLSRKLDDKTAVSVILNDFSNEQIQRLLDLEDGKTVAKKLSYSEAVLMVTSDFNDEQVKRYVEIKDIFLKMQEKEEDESDEINGISYYFDKKVDFYAAFSVKNNFDNIKAKYFYSLIRDFSEQMIMDVFQDEEKYSRFLELKSKKQNEEEYFNDFEALVAAQKDYDDIRAFALRDLMRSENFSSYMATMFINDTNKFNNYLYYTMEDENGNIPLTRKLTPKEAYNVIISGYDEKKAQELINILEENPEINFSSAIIIADFVDFKDKSNIYELSLAEKKVLLKKIIKYNAKLFDENFKTGYPLIPRSKEAYCEILPKLSSSIGISTKTLSQDEKEICLDGIRSISSSIKNVNLDNLRPKLVYSMTDFIRQMNLLLGMLDKTEQLKVMDYFGLEIKNGKLRGYPNLNEDVEKSFDITSTKTKGIIAIMKQFVKMFSENNSVIIPTAKSLENDLNKILEGLPELRTIIAKPQHATHSYSLDIHTLKVLQEIVKNPKYEELKEDDRLVLTIVALLHDITKAEGLIDKSHPKESAFDAYYIIQKLNLPESQQLKIYELIRTHDWLERLNKANPETCELLAQDYAFEMRHSNTFELAKILCEADLKSVKKDGSFFNLYGAALETLGNKVSSYIEELQSSQIFLPQTKIPKASMVKNGIEMEADGVKNVVIKIGDEENLEKYGFEKGTTLDNWSVLVHGLDSDQKLQTFATFSIIDSDALLSTSLMSASDYRVFRKQGLILDVNSNDIHVGYYRDFGSGFQKDIELLKNDYLFARGKKYFRKGNYRTYIPNLIKKDMGLINEEYIELIKSVEGCKSITDVEKISPEFAKSLYKVIKEMDYGKRSYHRAYNEILISRPKIQGIFSYEQPYEKIPLFLRKYAQDNDLPIIMFGDK